jgi:uncharacterized protein
MSFKAIAVIVLASSFAAFATAGPLEDGVAASNRGDHVTALRLLRPLADQGDAEAQFNLGLMYSLGRGVMQDKAEAARWLLKAAEQNHGDAQGSLGFCYDNGEGVPQNYAEAMKWYRKAADRGNADAQYNLGRMYEIGRGVPQDYFQAYIWFNLSAAQNNAISERMEVVSGQSSAKQRDLAAKHLSPAQIAEAQKLAREWKPNK